MKTEPGSVFTAAIYLMKARAHHKLALDESTEQV